MKFAGGILQIIGLAVIAFGAGLIWVPAGVMTAGLAVVAIGVAVEFGNRRAR